MQRIATFTKFHGNGDELIINGILNAEFQRQREREREYMNNLETKNSKLLKEKLDTFRAWFCPSCNKPFSHKAKDVLIFTLGCIICYAEMIKRSVKRNENLDS